MLNTPEIEEDDGFGNITPLPQLELQLTSINASMQVNDVLYYIKSANLNSSLASDVIKYGNIQSINNNNVIVDQANYVLSAPELEVGDFIMFTKNAIVNKSNITGHYVKARFKNNSTDPAELFAVSSETTISSK